MSFANLRHALGAAACLLALAACATTEPAKKDAETYYKEAEEFYANKHYEDAIAQWKKVKETFSSPELTAMADIKIADAQFDNESYIEAAASYEDFRKFHPKHALAPYALYRQGLCNYRQITGIDTDQTPVKNAFTILESFLREYPDDPHAGEVREKLEDCRTKLLQHEIYVGKFYLRTEKYPAAIKRFEEALVQYPNSAFQDETLLYLGKAYMLAGDKVKSREAFNRLSNSFPNSKHIKEAAEFMEKHY
jgi:outer membrane protein assembly factor BamD